jgi:hypothetical protein
VWLVFAMFRGQRGERRLTAESSVGSAVIVSLLVVAMLVYAAVLTRGFSSGGGGHGLIFNSMLEHLLRGQFDVDPNIVGREGFLRGGRVYAYWGVFCALLRLPLALIPGGVQTDVTWLSCLIAVCIAAAAKLGTLRLVYRACPASPLRETLCRALAFTILFAGAQTQFLRPSVYQEVCLWAGALAATFLYLAVRGVVACGFTRSALCGMATIAGLALLARVSTGLGLCAALGLLLLTGLWRDISPPGGVTPARESFAARLRSGTILWPTLVLLMLIGATGWVNYQRWGSPLTFADYNAYLFNEVYPDRLPRMAAFGLFNLTRIPFGLCYYFFPIWVLQRGDGHLLFAEHQNRLLDATELPPGSFFLTDSLLLLLTGVMVWYAGRRNLGIDWTRAIAMEFGFLVPSFLMLTAISMNFRYRVEFYPAMEFGAFLGFLALCRSGLTGTAATRISTLSVSLAAIAILGSILTLSLYRLSDFGPPDNVLKAGVYNYYMQKFFEHHPGFGDNFHARYNDCPANIENCRQ